MAGNLKMTGERLVPNDIYTPIEYIQYLRHLFVYETVKSEIKNDDNVIEVGFGEGYGTHMLSSACKSIIGLDIDARIVDYANNKYGHEKCTYQLYDGKVIPFDNNTFDITILFQVIEHIKKDINFIAQLHRVLKQGGRLFLTTPNKATRLKPGEKPWNRYHIREYYSHELEAAIRNSFDNVNVYGIGATYEIHNIEAERFKRGWMLTMALKLGFRKIIPKFLDSLIARYISNRRSRKKGQTKDKDLKDIFSIKDFRVEKIKVDESLDLFVKAIKT